MNDFIKNLFQPKDSFYVPVINREFYMFISIWDFSNIYGIAVLKSFFSQSTVQSNLRLSFKFSICAGSADGQSTRKKTSSVKYIFLFAGVLFLFILAV